jgi:hypothetical protein
VNIFRKAKFSDWLRKALLFIRRSPAIWVGYTLFVALILCLGRVSYALGILASVASLLVGVGVAKYIDMKHYSPQNSVSLAWAVQKSLPLAIIMGLMIVACWFLFSAIANIVNGEPAMILKFFFDWQFTPENLDRSTTRELAIWLYGYANITLIFVLLMMMTFASWFSYPLMLFKDFSWSRAKEAGKQEEANCRNALYKTLAFLVFEAILCTEVTPLLTPVLYMLTSTFIFITYKDYFER